MHSIETARGLREAIHDVLAEELEVQFTVAELLVRLPYGMRVREELKRLVRRGDVRRTGFGRYVQTFA